MGEGKGEEKEGERERERETHFLDDDEGNVFLSDWIRELNIRAC